MALTRRSAPSKRAPEVFDRLSQEYPGATVALRATTPLELLVATILSAQCTDKRVNEVTVGLFKKYRSAEDYLDVPDSELAADIRSTGFFNQKTKSIRGACARLVEVYGGVVPDTMAELVTLPGVARKTANVVLGGAFGKTEGIAVDTHVKRLSQRLGFSANTDPDKIERDLMGLIQQDHWIRTTLLLIDHGRAVCKARKPRCGECVVADLCPSSAV